MHAITLARFTGCPKNNGIDNKFDEKVYINYETVNRLRRWLRICRRPLTQIHNVRMDKKALWNEEWWVCTVINLQNTV